METILLIDDEEALCQTLEKVLVKEGYRVVWTTRGTDATDLLREKSPSCVLLDLKLGDQDGVAVLKQIREEDRDLPVIMLTAYATIKTAVEAMRLGAVNYLEKPFDNEELKVLVQKAVEEFRLRRQVKVLKSRLGEEDDMEAFMGSSEKVREVIKMVHSVAGSDVNVLLLGESGTGKEIVARKIHQLSKRSKGPFVPVDCASIPETLIESELFGHEKGAFTGAISTHKGKFELAEGGTIFLDEVGNIPLSLQPKLLRLLETREFQHVGGERPLKASVCVIAATNSDLAASSHSHAGGFRLDLFYRLNEFPIHLPPLRERREDIPLLAHIFLKQFQGETGSQVAGIAPQALERLQEYHFPGNVRELRNAIKRAMVMAKGEIEVADLPVEVRSRERREFSHEIQVPLSYDLSMKEVTRQALLQIEKRLIGDALRRSEGHHGKAAEILGVDPKTLYHKMKEYGF